MSTNFVYSVPTDETVNFTEALAQNIASAMNNLAGLPPSGSGWWYIRVIEILTKENYGPSLLFFSRAAGFTADPQTDKMLSLWSFTSAMGMRPQPAGSGLWRYYADGLAIPYIDEDTVGTVISPTVHTVLWNASATPKSANAAGNTYVRLWLEPMQSY